MTRNPIYVSLQHKRDFLFTLQLCKTLSSQHAMHRDEIFYFQNSILLFNRPYTLSWLRTMKTRNFWCRHTKWTAHIEDESVNRMTFGWNFQRNGNALMWQLVQRGLGCLRFPLVAINPVVKFAYDPTLFFSPLTWHAHT